MSLRIGFAILSYNEPGQLLRLTRTLGALFDGPPIVCHHNFNQCALDTDAFGSYVDFVTPFVNTQWGHITTVRAALRAFDVLRRTARPDWIVLLSGSDYPVRPADQIAAELKDATVDAFLDHRRVALGGAWSAAAPRVGFARPEWVEVAYDRYCALRAPYPRPSPQLLREHVFPVRRAEMSIRNPHLIRRFVKPAPAPIYGGAFWFQANARAIDALLDSPLRRAAISYFNRRPVPEESLIHTLLCNTPGVRISGDHKRYEDWTACGKHPKWLGPDDLPRVFDSSAHFARKFFDDGVTQDRVDRELLGLERPTTSLRPTVAHA